VNAELRVPTRDDFEGFFRPVFRAFGTPAPSAEELEDEQVLWEPERSLGALDGDEWVGSTGAYSYGLTVPGGAVVPAAGVTMVGVSPTHRRQGVLSALMARQLDDIAAGPEPLALLTASETSIYGRFGYGVVALVAGLELETDPRRSAFLTPSAAEGRIRMVRFDDGYELVQQAYERYRLLRPGSITRSAAYWDLVSRDRTDWRQGASGLFLAVHEDTAGSADGWVTWRVDQKWKDRLPGNTTVVVELGGVDAEVEAALWRFVLDIDLAARLRALRRPLDEPLMWRLREPRRLVTTGVSDWIWARIVDVPAALTARTWSDEGAIVLEVDDAFRPAWGGRFRLESGVDGKGACERTDAEADVVLGAEDLGALYLGGVKATTLARAGRIEERRPGALALADRLFAWDPLPFCNTGF
jgi:predicted acetyltransferase